MNFNQVDRSGAPSPSSLVPLGEAIDTLSQASALQTQATDSITALNRAASPLDATVSVTVPATPHEIVFIDTGITDYQSLLSGAKSTAEVVLLNASQDGVSQITSFLAQRTGVSALHIVSHGSTGALQLGNTHLNWETIHSYESALKSWAKAFTTGADILLYGCDVAAGDLGTGFVQSLGFLTGADIAASNDLTGSAAKGGDWELEVNTGAIAANLAFKAEAIATYGYTFDTAITTTQIEAIGGGLDSFLTALQSKLDMQVTGSRLPILGTGLKAATQFFDATFRNPLKVSLDSVKADAAPTIEKVQKAISDALGGLLDGVITPTIVDGDNFTFNLKLKQALADSTTPISLDLGLPALQFDVGSDLKLKTQVGYDFAFKFGLNSGSFNVDTSASDELNVNFDVKADSLNVNAKLGLLKLNVKDAADAPTKLSGGLAIDLQGAPSSLSLISDLTGGLSTNASINLDLSTTFGSDFPSFKTRLAIDWGLNPDFSLKQFDVDFKNTRIGLDSLTNSFIKPIGDKINDILKPIQPVIDILNTKVPVIDVRIIDLLGSSASSVNDFLDIYNALNTFSTIAATGEITLINDLKLNDFLGGGLLDLSAATLKTANVGALTGSNALPAAFKGLADLGVQLPILTDPKQFFRLLIGDDTADLFSFDLNLPSFTTGASQSVQIWVVPPVYANIAGDISLGIQLGFGYDAKGLTALFSGTGAILDGFYLKDTSGLSLGMGVEASGGLGTDNPVFTAALAIEARLQADVKTKLQDIKDSDGKIDGKLRTYEIQQRFAQGPLCLFGLDGKVSIGIFGEGKVGLGPFKKSIRKTLIDRDLLNFDTDECGGGNPPLPELATPIGDVLRLNMGRFAGDRNFGSREDENEVFKIEHVSGTKGNETVRVTAFGFSRVYTGVREIYAEGGQRNDTIELAPGVLSESNLWGDFNPTNPYGGPAASGSDGNDRLSAGNGRAELHGGGGDDYLTAEDAPGLVRTDSAFLYGDDGNDEMAGGGSDDFLYGGAGQDSLYGNGGSDVLYGDRRDGATADLSGIDPTNASDFLNGGEGDDSLYGELGNDYLEGQDGNDRLEGGAGNDDMRGGRGNDTLIGGASTNLATDGNDIINGEDGADIVLGDNGQIDSSGIVTLISGTGNDTLSGGAGDDTLYGQGGNDNLYGNTGNDALIGGVGADLLTGGAGNDTLSGNQGNDVLFGEEGQRVELAGSAVRYESINLGLTGNDIINGNEDNDIAIGGGGNDQILGDVGNDIALIGDNGRVTVNSSGVYTRIETLGTAGGNDTITGSVNPDIILGGIGNDTILDGGGNAVDLLLGDNGIVYGADGTTNANDIVSTDTSVGGRDDIHGGGGNDIIIGGANSDNRVNGFGGLFGDAGDDIVLGDNARITRDAANVIQKIETIAPADGGDDLLEDTNGNSILIGGVGNDVITSGVGADTLIGDNGEITFNGAQVLRISTKDAANGGNDTLTGGDSADMILGGTGNDAIFGGNDNADDILLGDNGAVVGADGTAQANDIFSTDPDFGGRDSITGGGGEDIILGGSGGLDVSGSPGDNLSGGSDDDIMLGDGGYITRNASNTIEKIETLFSNKGGDDTIDGGTGITIALGGFGNDTITADTGADILLGDNGIVNYSADGNLTTLDFVTATSEFGGNDTITANSGNDIILGGDGNDNLSGNAGQDTILGDNGNVTLQANLVTRVETTEAATSSGNDTILGGNEADVVLGGSGNDSIVGGDDNAADSLLGDNGVVVGADGTAQANDIFSTDPDFGGRDTITGGGGKDIILGGSGGGDVAGSVGDSLSGGSDDDIILGDGGKITRNAANAIEKIETLFSNKGGDDTIDGGSGMTIALGGFGNDSITADTGADLLLGDNGVIDYSADGNLSTLDFVTAISEFGGNDTITGKSGNDIIIGGAANDTLAGDAGQDTILGDNGKVTLQANIIRRIETTDEAISSGNDTITGGNDADIALGGSGNDSITGGNDNADDILLGDNGIVVRADGSPQANDIFSTDPDFGGRDTITGGGGNDIIIGGSGGSDTTGVGGDNLSGNDGNDVVIGDNAYITRNAANVIEKIATIFPNKGGDDTIAGNAGDDILIGGFGNDAIAGSTGNDIILGDNGLLDYTVDGNLTTLDLITTTDPGLGGSDTITGDEGDDIALGGFAGDTIAGNAGNDILLGDNGRIAFSGTQITRIETIDPSLGGNDGIQGNEGTDRILGGFGNDALTGNQGNDIILGDNGLLNYGVDANLATLDLITTTDTVTATGGADAIAGNDGNDIILGGVAGDAILGDSGNGKAKNPGADILLGDNGQMTLTGGIVSLIETITPGLGGNDTISGNEDDDLIAGGFGDDTLYGDAGIDRILGDNGNFNYNYAEAGVVTNDNNLATLDFFTTTNPTLGGNDLIFGGFGNDIVLGGTGADTIYGDDGIDVLDANWLVAGIADFTGDGKLDVFWRNRETGQNLIWQMDGSSAIAALPSVTLSLDWSLAGTADFNKDGQTDLLWRNQTTGANAIWLMVGTMPTSGLYLPTMEGPNWQIKGIADFDNDGNADLLWRNQATGENLIWTLTGTVRNKTIFLPLVNDVNWDIKGIADFDNDGDADLLWRNRATGDNIIWTLTGTALDKKILLTPVGDVNWDIKGIADFDNDGDADLLWRNQATGENIIWTLTGTVHNSNYLPQVKDSLWHLEGAADFNGDGRGDLFWHRQTGETSLWQVNGLSPTQIDFLPLGDRPTTVVNGTQWAIDGKADFDQDGQVDLLWRNQITGENAIWLMRGTHLKQEVLLPTVSDRNWMIKGIADFDNDGDADLLWRNQATGDNIIWTLTGSALDKKILLTPVGDVNWDIKGIADFDNDGDADLLWRNKATGDNIIWTLTGTALDKKILLTPVGDVNWDIKSVADFNHNGNADLLWRNKATGENAIWTLNGTALDKKILLTRVGDVNWDIKGTADFNDDGNVDLLWRNQATGQTSIWTLNGTVLDSSVFLPQISDLNWDLKGTADFNTDGSPDLLWYNRATGQSVSWLLNGASLSLGVFLQNGTEANDLLLGDHGKVYTALPAGQNYVSIDTQMADGGGNDLIFGNQGDDTILGQQGNDRLFGETGEDDIIGGHNVVGGADGDDTIDGGAQADVVLGDNGTITRRVLGYNLWQRYPQPFADVIRDVVRFDDRDRIGGSDTIYGGSGDDILHGQRGNDGIFGNAGDDEIYGELGNDAISGGAGQDTALGDVGIITRAYNADGTPRLNLNGSWHRDVILTDVGKLIGTVSPNALTRDLFQTTDRFLLTATASGTDTAVQLISLYDDGSDVINGDAGDDNLFGQRGNDTMNGGSGNDYIQGNAGDDQINGDSGDDVVIGDDGNSAASFNTQLPTVVQGIHLIDKNAGVGIDLGTYGTVVLPSVTIEPQMTYGLLPTLALVPQLPRDASPVPTIGTLKTSNGTILQPLASIVPDLVHHLDLLTGNDQLNGGAGNDKIVGDNDSAFMPLRTGNAAFDLTLDQTTRRLYQLVYDLHDLELVSASISGAAAQVLQLGNDTIAGDDGNDTIYGDHNTFFGPVVMQLPGNASTLSSLLGNLNQAIASFSGGVTNLLVPFAGGVSSQPYTLSIGNDAIDGGNGDDKVFADDSIQIAPLVNSLPYQRGSFWQTSLTIGLDRPGRNNVRDFDLILGNDTVSGGGGNDLLEGDYSTVVTPIITATTPLSVQERNSLNVLIKDINDFVRDRYQDKHGIDYNNRNRDNALIAQNDQLQGNDGNDLILGDNATFVLPFLNGQVNLSMNLNGSILDYLDASDEAHNFFQGLPHQYDTLFRNLATGFTQLAQDTISGGDGSDILYGLIARDSLYGDALPGEVSTNPGNDYLFGGQETDTLVGGGGTDIVRTTNPSPSDEVAIAPTVNAHLLDLLSPATRQYLLDSLTSKDTLALTGDLYIDLPG